MDSALSVAQGAGVNRPTGPVIVTVCTSCRTAGVEREDAPGKVLFETLSELAKTGEVIIRPTQCLSVCKRVCTVSLTAEGGYTYLFGDLAPEHDGAAILEMARAMAGADYGFVPWNQRPEAVRNGLLARVPPPSWSPEDGSAPG